MRKNLMRIAFKLLAFLLLVAPLAARAVPSVTGVSGTTAPRATPKQLAVARAVDAIGARAAKTSPGREARLVKSLQALGPAALQPMLDRLATPTAQMKSLPPKAHALFRASLAEAIGTLQSPESLPVLAAVFDQTKDDARLEASLARALAKLCRVSKSLDALAPHALAGHPHERTTVDGLGSCRTESAARLLRAKLAAGDEAMALSAVNSLGLQGSSWAWKALGTEANAEGLALRTASLDALLVAYPTATPALQKAIGQSVLMLDVPGTETKLAGGTFAPVLAKWTRMHARAGK